MYIDKNKSSWALVGPSEPHPLVKGWNIYISAVTAVIESEVWGLTIHRAIKKENNNYKLWWCLQAFSM